MTTFRRTDRDSSAKNTRGQEKDGKRAIIGVQTVVVRKGKRREEKERRNKGLGLSSRILLGPNRQLSVCVLLPSLFFLPIQLALLSR